MGDYTWTATNQDIEQIEKMSAYWLPEKYIASILGITLTQYHDSRASDERITKAEDAGRARGAKRLYETAFIVAVEQQDVKMLTFCLKAQEKWRDSDPPNINIQNFSGSLPTTEEAIRIIERMNRRQVAQTIEVKPLEEDV